MAVTLNPIDNPAIAPNNKPQQIKLPWRLRLRAGFHFDNDPNGRMTMYSPGDVFLSRYNYAKKWPEKFERVADYVPLSGGDKQFSQDGEWVDLEQMNEDSEVVSQSDSVLPDQGVQAPIQQAQPSVQQAQTPTKKPPRQEDDATLTQMTVNELKSYAEDEEIDLGNATRKEEILKIIRQHRPSVVGVK